MEMTKAFWQADRQACMQAGGRGGSKPAGEARVASFSRTFFLPLDYMNCVTKVRQVFPMLYVARVDRLAC